MRVLRHPRLVVLAVLIATLAAARLASTQLGLNTDTAALLSADLPFRQAHRHYQEEFPAMVDVFLAVIDGDSAARATEAARALVGALQANPDLFPEVFLPGSEAYFERNALLYPAAEELEQIIDRLIAGQAVIGLLARDPTLPGVASGLATILGEASPGDSAVSRLLAAIEPGLDIPPEPVSWQSVLMDETPFAPAARRLVQIRPALDFNALLPADRAMAALRAAIDDTEAAYPEARIRVTGDAALAHEEMDTALSGTLPTAALALTAVTALLIIGPGTAWLAGACLASLVSGLILTAGFAALAVGELNLISMAFSVLYIGLAVDYSIHFCLAYREELPRHDTREAALRAAMTQLRRPLALCTVTTSLGFFAFLPTSFRGVAELGLIAGAGMVINLLLTFLLLPALLACVPRPPAWVPPGPTSGRIPARGVLLTAALLTLASAALLPSLGFDRDPLNLRDPSSESVATFRALLADPGQSAQGVTVLLPDADTARRMAAELAALPQVREVQSLDSMVPAVTAEKLALIDELAVVLQLSSAARTEPTPTTPQRMLVALEVLQQDAAAYASRGTGDDGAAAFARHLRELLRHLREADPAEQARQLRAIEAALTAGLPRLLGRLQAALSPDEDPAATLPESIRAQWVGRGGQHRLWVLPQLPLASEPALRDFVDAVQRVAPGATDEPVLNLRAGDEIVGAFRLAFALAVAVITLLLLGLLRDLRHVLLVLAPVGSAALLTGSTLVLLDVPLNFANVIALPLLFGIGVDNGVHVLQRALRDPGFAVDPYRSATARAMVFSGATTLAGFGALMLSPHPGTASMGIVLGVGVGWILVATLLVLPTVIRASPRAVT